MAPQPTRRDRWLALGLLLAMIGLIYLLLVHPLWTQPLREVDTRIAGLQERQQRIELQLRQAPQVAQRLQQAQALLAEQPGFMPEASAELATSRLVQRLEEAARQASPDNRSCAISDRSPMPADSSGRFVRVAVQARLRCGMAEWMNVLQALESGTPQLRVERLDILASAATEGGSGLDVSFELSGYLRPGTATATAAAAPEVSNAQ
ncbi:type II secretion system protein GspM [Stenotrophomonas sp. SY1]|uniref:type II secretion system protein GspM n=1 Tax=Stenotrophomonas sp. SY1 TaxID=477235 RepID=UPI001E461BDA|nr:type II secretion system protein GspM [Stenotrophomonas sp. SY1]MCD9085935.1 type II secretion system protein GspM [Stenotrophomonas sp. SY1]